MKKLPDNARLMFEGVRYNIWQWEQTMFDGSTAIFEAAARADSVTIIGTVGDKILVLREEQPGQEPFLALPGGHSEGLESPEKTAKKKLLQEAGYAIHDLKSWFTAPYGWVLGDNYYYIARNVTKEAEPAQDPGDKISTELISFDEFVEFRKNAMIRNKELLPILERAANNKEEYDKLHDVIFGSALELQEAQELAKKQEEELAKKEEEEAEKALEQLKLAAQKEAEEKALAIHLLEQKRDEARKKAEALILHEEKTLEKVVTPQEEVVTKEISSISPVGGVSDPLPSQESSSKVVQEVPFSLVPQSEGQALTTAVNPVTSPSSSVQTFSFTPLSTEKTSPSSGVSSQGFSFTPVSDVQSDKQGALSPEVKDGAYVSSSSDTTGSPALSTSDTQNPSSGTPL